MNRIRLASAMRGLYRRIADRLGVDPSYVSRVARGERRSAKIAAQLNREVLKILSATKTRQRRT